MGSFVCLDCASFEGANLPLGLRTRSSSLPARAMITSSDSFSLLLLVVVVRRRGGLLCKVQPSDRGSHNHRSYCADQTYRHRPSHLGVGIGHTGVVTSLDFLRGKHTAGRIDRALQTTADVKLRFAIGPHHCPQTQKRHKHDGQTHDDGLYQSCSAIRHG